MDTGERLAAYLSGDLDTDERTALEADLAGDPALRARLERIRAADTALADLPEPELPEGFSARLRERVAPEVDAVVGDELAGRRARRTPGWLPALGAAAALALVVAGGVSLSGGMGGDDTAADRAEDGGARTMAGDDAGGADTMLQDESAEAMAPPAGPIVTDRGRTFGPDELAELASDPDIAAFLDADALADPTQAANDFTAALRDAGGELERGDDTGTESGGDAAAEEDAADVPATQESGTEAATLDLGQAAALVRGDVSSEDLEAVAACLDVLSEGAAHPVVPLYVELATTAEGTDVIVYAALSRDADDAYQRVEIWMVDRDSCDVLQFVQQDA